MSKNKGYSAKDIEVLEGLTTSKKTSWHVYRQY